MESGADKIRINPGNIGARERVKAVVDKAKEYNIPIRVGVNSGSLEKELVERYGRVTAEALVESARREVQVIEELGYDNLRKHQVLRRDDVCQSPRASGPGLPVSHSMWGSPSQGPCFLEILNPLWAWGSSSTRALGTPSVFP